MTANVEASVKARLRNKMHDSGLDFQFLLTSYARERFLYRLGASHIRDRCILKGASLLAVWMDEPYRATRDVDMLALDGFDERYVRQLMATICAVPCPEDALRFDLSSLRVFPIRTGQPYPSQRIKLTARLGIARIPLQVDIGFGDVVVPGPEEVQFPTLMEGMAAPSVRAYPRTSTVAEKLEAIVQLGQQNSRMKDFHDVWALSETFSFDGSVLSRAIQACFARRKTDWTTLAPLALTPTFYANAGLIRRWTDYRTSTNLVIPPPDAFHVVGERIVAFVGPIRESVLDRVPFDMDWPPGGPWQIVVLC
ncbi:MAG: nucleotidyl transferase AbiEii/AbiGii toxin family protein [Spirochaetaceae bacterium]|nr:nucleotidyl transferase AbiEii/AbiGii toxin family protein [Spirochaetaceae bacterium]